jgi:4-hydroxybenzoate polyprenyltransferase
MSDDRRREHLALGWLAGVFVFFIAICIGMYGLRDAFGILVFIVAVVLTALSLCVLNDISDT